MILQAKQLSIQYGGSMLVEPFDWTVNAGEKWAILGANGAGKSSLLRTICGMETDQYESVLFNEQPLKSLSPRVQAAHRLWVPQRYDEPFNITVWQALSSLNQGRSEAHLQASLEAFGLLKMQNHWVHQLSGGERQRLTWAMAHAHQQPSTQLWLLDEPFAAQDLAWQVRLLRYLKALPCAAVAAVHDVNQVADFASHVLMLISNANGVHRVMTGEIAQMMRAEPLEDVYGVPFHAMRSEDGRFGWWRI